MTVSVIIDNRTRKKKQIHNKNLLLKNIKIDVTQISYLFIFHNILPFVLILIRNLIFNNIIY